MPRLLLSDELWLKLRIILLHFGVYDKHNLRKMVEGMFYRLRTGLPFGEIYLSTLVPGMLFIRNLTTGQQKVFGEKC